MKQLAAIFVMVFFGIGGAVFWTPAAAVCMYYFFAVLRPQWLWKFQLSAYPGLALLTWSFYLAAASIGSYLLWSVGLLSFGRSERSVMRYSPAITWAFLSMILFAFWISLSFIFSNDQPRSEDWYGEYLKIFVMYFVAARVLRTPNQIWALYMLTTLALAYIAIDANQIYISSGNVVLFRRGYALLDNNGAGLLLALGVPLCFFAWEMTFSRVRWFFLIAALSLVHAVLTTYSRGAMIAMIAPIFHYAFFSFKFARNKIYVACIAVCVCITVPIMAGKEITERFTSIKKREVDDSYQSRELSWRIATEIANDYPLVGAGIRCSALEMLKRGADMDGRTIHSQYLQIAADSGWVAMAIYLLVVGTTFLAIWQARFKLWKRRDPEAIRALAILNGVECALISFLVGALALSLEVFEPSYLLMLIGAQVWALMNSTDTAQPEMNRYRQQSLPVRPRPMPRETPRPQNRQGPSTGKHPFDRFQQPSMPRRGGP